MSEPKSQHIIPRCYLKQFVDPHTPIGYEPYVWLFERGNKQGKKRAPENILAKTDFYTLKLKNGEKDYSIEKNLAQIESDYASVFEHKIKDKKPLDYDEHVVLCAFVAAMLQRTLKQKERVENLYDRLIEKAERMEAANGMPPRMSLELKERKEWAHKLTLMETVPEITKILLQMNLAIFCTNKNGSFITSDAPCFLFNHRLQWQRFFSPTFGQKNVEVRMPLSPEIAICFSWANNLRGYLNISPDWVHELNRMIYGHSHKHFIANSSKLKRGWFRHFPLDPVFISRILTNKIRIGLQRWRYRHKSHV